MEEPVSSDDREGLRLLRDQGPPGLDIAAGEYGYVLRDFADLLQAGAVDCLQADVTRCSGITGLLQVSGLCSAHSVRSVGALRTGDFRACVLRGGETAPPGVFPRSRANRANAI